jgi:hypothetical protein
MLADLHVNFHQFEQRTWEVLGIDSRPSRLATKPALAEKLAPSSRKVSGKGTRTSLCRVDRGDEPGWGTPRGVQLRRVGESPRTD